MLSLYEEGKQINAYSCTACQLVFSKHHNHGATQAQIVKQGIFHFRVKRATLGVSDDSSDNLLLLLQPLMVDAKRIAITHHQDMQMNCYKMHAPARYLQWVQLADLPPSS